MNGMRRYRVDWGSYESGITISVMAKTIDQALGKARYVANAKGYTGEAVQVHDGEDIVWDYMNGNLKDKKNVSA